MRILSLSLVIVLAGTRSALPTNPAALARGLDTVRPDAIRSDLTFLASDELQGRDTPSPGLRIAARYLVARVSRLGFTPAGENDSFYDPYELDRVGLDLESTGARFVGGAPFVFGEDYFFDSDGFRDLELEGELVFAGRATPEELRAVELDGRFALVWDDPAASSTQRAELLRQAGALGAVYLQPPEVGYKRADRIARYSKRRAEKGALRVSVVDEPPEIYLTEHGAGLLGVDLEKLALGTVLPQRFAEKRVRSADSEVHVVENVAALWPGSDPELREEVIVLSAHYDHVGVEDGQVYNGADDNGSGTSGLLAIADALKEYGPMRRSVLLLWVSGEEKGLKGSWAWTTAPTLPAGYRAVCDLNIDMIGRNAPDLLLITPSKERPEYNALVQLAEEYAPSEGFPKLGGCDDYWQRSDHMNFAENLHIPVAFLFSDVHPDYHQPTDDVEKIDFDKIRRVTRLILRVLDGLQEDSLLAR